MTRFSKKYDFLNFWISGFLNFLDFWLYLGNKKSYRRSAGVKTIFLGGFRFSKQIISLISGFLSFLGLLAICHDDANCLHEMGRNQISPFWIQVMFSVFRGPKYDDIRPNHTKKIKKRPKNSKKTPKRKKSQNCTTLHCNAQ